MCPQEDLFILLRAGLFLNLKMVGQNSHQKLLHSVNKGEFFTLLEVLIGATTV